MTMIFERWKPIDSNTWSYKLFIQHHTQLNDMYWSQVPVFHYVNYLYRHKQSAVQDTYSLLQINPNGYDAMRAIPNVDGWNSSMKDFMNWTRLNSLVALSSYFEIFLGSIVSLALDSDLGNIYGLSRQIDGIKLVKNNLTNTNSKYSQIKREIITGITKGTWDQRVKNFESVFGDVPQEIKNCIKDLERIRSLRNKVAHGFGKDIERSRETGLTEILPMERLSEKTLKKWMEVIRSCAQAIDKQLNENHIGEYQYLFFYHKHKHLRLFRDPQTRGRSLVQLINPRNLGKYRTKFYAESLIDYYNSI